ncbi:MAG TPA: methyltransferase [Rhizomicrobium sp.]
MNGDPTLLAEKLMAAGRPREAAEMIRARIESGRGGLLARQALVRALLAAGDNKDALAEAREAAALNPGIATAQSLLGEALLQSELLPAAIAEFQRALRLEPGLDAARHGLGVAWLKAGEAQKALEAFADVTPSPELAARIAQAQEMLDAPRSDAGYVRHLFDQFSGDYDQRMLGPLSYAGPQILRQLADLVMAGRSGFSILDLGCGTGLAGMAFADLAARLDGIDLSPAMIEKARSRGLYDGLAVDDLENALAGEGFRYDLILAADTLVYLGDLRAVFAGAARNLAHNGFFLFTTETQDGPGFALGPKRRWRHSPDYLKAMAAEAGLAVAGLVACAPRTEANVPVEGLAAALTRPC